jgi:molybdopterin-guanine dinucleotide biosynthesis protein A
MLGVNKPLWPVTHNGIRQSMIDHVIGATADVESVLISANSNLAQYTQRGLVISDAQQQLTGAGPLAGILAGLRYATTPWLLICPGDTPYLRSGWHHALRKRRHDSPEIDAVVVHDGERLQPLHLLLRTNLESHLDDHIGRGHRSAWGWLESLNTAEVAFSDPEQFRSVNRFADLD